VILEADLIDWKTGDFMQRVGLCPKRERLRGVLVWIVRKGRARFRTPSNFECKSSHREACLYGFYRLSVEAVAARLLVSSRGPGFLEVTAATTSTAVPFADSVIRRSRTRNNASHPTRPYQGNNAFVPFSSFSRRKICNMFFSCSGMISSAAD